MVLESTVLYLNIPNNSHLKKNENKVALECGRRLSEMREGKLCSETLSLWSEDMMIMQSLLLFFIHECTFSIAFIASKTFQSIFLRAIYSGNAGP